MSYQDVPLIGFAPDLDTSTPGVFLSCVGYEPTRRGWRLSRDYTTTSFGAAAALGKPVRAVSTVRNDGTAMVHAADAVNSKLFVYDGTSANVSSGATYHNMNFTFAQYGNYTIAANLNDVIEYRDSSSSANLFATLAATSIPKAAIVRTWGPPTAPRSILFNYNDGTAYTDGWWSGNKGGPTTTWAVDLATEASNGRLLGAITINNALPYKDQIIAWSDNQMWVGSYNPPYTPGWEKVAEDVGCAGTMAACVGNNIVYFLGRQGLFYYDGSYPRRLNVPIQKWLVQLASSSSVLTEASLAFDPVSNRLLLALRSTAAVNGSGVEQPAQYILSIDLYTLRVGQLPTTQTGVSLYQVLSFANGQYVNPIVFTGSNGSNMSVSKPSDYQGAAPILNARTTNYIELAPFSVNEDGSLGPGEFDGTLTRIYPRFARSHACKSFGVAYAPLTSASATPSYTAESISPITTDPWRMDLTHSAKWHALELFVNTTGAEDPELIGLKVQMVRNTANT